MNREEAYDLQAFIEKETGWRNVGIKQFGCGWVTTINKGTHDVYIWHLQDWYNYRLTMSTKTTPVKTPA